MIHGISGSPRNILSESEDLVMFVNAGGCTVQGQDPRSNIIADSCFQGGDVIETDETIVEGGDYPSLYQSARYGDFCYKFEGLAPGDYFLDLHFSEIVNTNGPKGIRAFDVFVQEEKARIANQSLKHVFSLLFFFPKIFRDFCR